MKTYKDIYVFPLSVNTIGWVRDKKGQFVFQFQFSGTTLHQQFLNVINGDAKPSKEHNFTHNDGYISENNTNYILIRGWGNLTGTGGHNLSPEEAANVQDTFAEFIVNQLNQKP